MRAMWKRSKLCSSSWEKKTKLLGVGTVDAGEKRFDASEIQRLPVEIDNIISHY